MTSPPAAVGAYFDGREIVTWSRDEGGGRVLARHRAEHACYLRTADVAEDVLRRLRSTSAILEVRPDGDEWTRLRFRDRDVLYRATAASLRGEDGQPRPGLLPGLGLKTHEADLDPVRRWSLETGVEVLAPRRGYLDLETDSRVPFSKKETARILSWSLGDDSGEMVTGVLEADTDEAERELLLDLWHELEGYDQVAAWNGDDFDFPVLHARTLRHRLRVDPRQWLWVDHLPVFQRMNVSSSKSGDEKQSMSLNAVAFSVAGMQKLTFDSSNTWEAWSAGGERRDELARYNAHDVRLMIAIEGKTGYLELHNTLSRTCGLFPDTRAANPLRYVDNFILRLARARGMRLPTSFVSPDTTPFEGAFVFPATKGLVTDVHIVDFASMYPSIIRSWNMSFETITDDVLEEVDRPTYLMHAPATPKRAVPPGCCESPSGAVFRVEPEGLLALAVAELLRLRKHWTKLKASFPPESPEWIDADRRAMAYKVAANAFYGVQGCKWFRLFNRDVAEAVTLAGQWMIKCVARIAEERGMRAIGGDTDSLFVAGGTSAQMHELVRYLNESFFPAELKRMGTPRCELRLEYEKAHELMLVLAKKNYCNTPEAPIWMADGSFKPLGEIRVGDEVAGWIVGGRQKKRTLARSTVVAKQRRASDIVKVTMESGHVFRCTPDHQWLRQRRLTMSRGSKHYSYQWQTPKVGRELVRVIEKPKELTHALQVEAAWLGGIWDGEGSLANAGRSRITIAQSVKKNPEVCARIESSLKALGFAYTVQRRPDGMHCYMLTGDKQTRVNFAHWCRPAKAHRFAHSVLRSRFGKGDRILKVEPDGRGHVISMETTTGNYVAWGYASKNCARYAHYKGNLPDASTKPEVKGLEYKRGDTSKLARQFQAEILDLLLGGGILGPRRADVCVDPRAFRSIVDRWRDRILTGPLLPEEVMKSQRLTMPIEGYAVKRKKDGTVAAQPPHVEVAKKLKARGVHVQEGSKIDYYVADGSVSPARVEWVGDWDGTFDRFHLWEHAVYPAALRVLDAAFPEPWWDAQHAVRPRKERGVLPGQLKLFS